MSQCDDCPGYAAPGCCLVPHIKQEQEHIADKMKALQGELEAREARRKAERMDGLNRHERRAAASRARRYRP